MKLPKLGSLLVIAGLLSIGAHASAQQPTAAQAQQMLQNNPALLQQLRQRVMTSGLTPDQVRARLRAEGYPETLLDAYLGTGTSGAEVVNAGTQEDVYNAIAQLGIVDTTEAQLLRCATIPVSDSIMQSTDTSRAAITAKAQALGTRARCKAQLDSINGVLSPADSAKQRAFQDSGYVIFGVSMFRQATTLFDANLN